MTPALARAVLVLVVAAASLPALADGEGGEALGFEERLGDRAALEARFVDDGGAELGLGELSGKPLVLVLAYYRCKDQCSTLLVGLARALRGVEGRPGVDWQVATVSINPREGPEDAREKKAIALAALEKPFPPGAWAFLVGSHGEIDRLADSIGFAYREVGEDYDHPLGAVVLAPDGKIVRYIQGPEFLAVDLSMSILEASRGVVRPTVAKVLRFCLTYDASKKQYGLDILRVSGIITTALVAALAIVLVVKGRKRHSEREA